MKSENTENSLQTAVRWAWDIFVISNTLAALSMKQPKLPAYEDVEEVIAHNNLVLEDLTATLKRLADFNFDHTASAFELERLIEDVNGACEAFNYQDRSIQALQVKVRQMLIVYKGKLRELEAKGELEHKRYTAEAKRRWTEYRRANGIRHPQFTRRVLTVIYILVGATWLALSMSEHNRYQRVLSRYEMRWQADEAFQRGEK